MPDGESTNFRPALAMDSSRRAFCKIDIVFSVFGADAVLLGDILSFGSIVVRRLSFSFFSLSSTALKEAA